MELWGDGITSIDRQRSYFMEECVDVDRKLEAIQLMHKKGFFLDLPPMEGAVQGLKDMRQSGLFLPVICTSPLPNSDYCIEEKMQWVRKHLGEECKSCIHLL